jgi:NAD(P)-dependent dehydrogenase (short-subunit alcohol dehydrogenase family)
MLIGPGLPSTSLFNSTLAIQFKCLHPKSGLVRLTFSICRVLTFWLEVTGSSVGLGRCTVEHLLAQGEKVVATLRKPSALSDLSAKYPASQLLVVKLDVTSPADIEAAFAKAVETFGRVDVLYNNAGYGSVGEIEGTPDDVARGVFEVNFWGSTNVAREAIRVFRDVNKPAGGRLLQASSMAGAAGMPGIGYYSAR